MPMPRAGGIDRVDDLDRDAVQADLAGVGQDQPDEDLHQRRLAGPVLAEDAVDPPPVEGQVHAVARRHLPEPLGDADELDCGWGAGLPTRRRPGG